MTQDDWARVAGRATSAAEVRRAIRGGAPPSAFAQAVPDRLRCHVAAVEARLADAFERFCAVNGLPLVARGAAGCPRLEELGDDLDVRTDLGGYVLRRDGTEWRAASAAGDWTASLVTFAFAAGAPVRAGAAAPGGDATVAVAPFAGPLDADPMAGPALGPLHRLGPDAGVVVAGAPGCPLVTDRPRGGAGALHHYA